MDQSLVHMNFPRNFICLDQWRSKFSESFSLYRYWSIRLSRPQSTHRASLGALPRSTSRNFLFSTPCDWP